MIDRCVLTNEERCEVRAHEMDPSRAIVPFRIDTRELSDLRTGESRIAPRPGQSSDSLRTAEGVLDVFALSGGTRIHPDRRPGARKYRWMVAAVDAAMLLGRSADGSNLTWIDGVGNTTKHGIERAGPHQRRRQHLAGITGPLEGSRERQRVAKDDFSPDRVDDDRREALGAAVETSVEGGQGTVSVL